MFSQTAADAQVRIEALRREIAEADELYFRQSAPAISDADYDRLKRELAALEAAHPDRAAAPGATALGDDRTGRFPTRRHRERMRGLAKCYTREELEAFFARTERPSVLGEAGYVVEPKYDGLAISVTYERGRLVQAVTRGNGIEGDDVTANVAAIRSLPHGLRATAADGTANPIPDVIELRGEVYVGLAEFRRINAAQEAAGGEPFSHPRNLAAGTLKQADPGEVAARRLAIVFYGTGACEPASAAPRSQQALHALIRAWGLPGVERVAVARSRDEAWAAIGKLGRDRARLAYPIDGAVVKVDAVAQRTAAGADDDAPGWAVAWKFAPERAATRLRAIALQIGRTGVVTPVAELEPVRLGGATIARASLHNFAEIRRRDLRVGDVVFVEKAGEIIPAVVGIDPAARPADCEPYEEPRACPACRADLVRAAGAVAVRCPNSGCPAQLRRRLAHFASEACVDIDGLGPATIERLVGRGRVGHIADLYRLRREDLVAAGGTGEKSAGRLLAAIERSRRAELWRFIHGLGIADVGPATARALAARFGDLPALAGATREELFEAAAPRVPGVNAAAAESVLAFFARPENRSVIDALQAAGVCPRFADAADG